MFQKHRIALLEQVIRDLRADFAERIAELKSTHAEQMKYAISECERLRDDLDRTRLFLNPGLANVSTSRTPDTSGPPVPENVPVGGAWSRVLAREMKKQQDDAIAEEAERKRIAAEAPKVAAIGAPDGQAEVSRPH